MCIPENLFVSTKENEVIGWKSGKPEISTHSMGWLQNQREKLCKAMEELQTQHAKSQEKVKYGLKNDEEDEEA